jgi:hypothetical protein
MEIFIGLGIAAWIFGAVGAYWVVFRKLSKELETLSKEERKKFFMTRRQRIIKSPPNNRY